MFLERAIYEILSADAALTALCPAAKMFPWDETQNVSLPFLKHFPVAIQPIHTHDGLAALSIVEYYQISCFASHIRETRGIADAVKTALDGVHITSDSPADGLTAFFSNERAIPYDFDVRCAGIAVDFRIAHAAV